ncbi:MAG: hypothetical protein Q9216_004694 [Gyalolechia sp. 2 TL-2023]
MGYQPVIDSYETWTGSDWTSRREVLAWGAGAELVVRIKWMGPDIEKQWQSARLNKDSKDNVKEFDQHHHKFQWWRVTNPSHRDGHDDITAVKLLRNGQRPLDHCEYVVIGRANGELDMVSIDRTIMGTWKMETRFLTDGRNIRSASINSADQPLLAACVDDHTIAVYPISAGHDFVPPLGKIQVTSSEDSCRIWSTVFLRQDRLAIGLGPSVDPIQVYEIKPDAISSQPIRRFAIHENCFKGYPTIGSVYPLVPLPQSSSSSASEGDLFLSGGHDGIISLDHTSTDHECSAITDPNSKELESDRRDPRHWNVFLQDRRLSNWKRSESHPPAASPIYSLSSPSLCSPTIFAGVEGRVIQLDVTSAYDHFPDPVFKFGLKNTGQDYKYAVRKWDPHHNVMSLSTYEQVRGPVTLHRQSNIGEPGSTIPGCDERWRSLSDAESQ